MVHFVDARLGAGELSGAIYSSCTWPFISISSPGSVTGMLSTRLESLQCAVRILTMGCNHTNADSPGWRRFVPTSRDAKPAAATPPLLVYACRVTQSNCVEPKHSTRHRSGSGSDPRCSRRSVRHPISSSFLFDSRLFTRFLSFFPCCVLSPLCKLEHKTKKKEMQKAKLPVRQLVILCKFFFFPNCKISKLTGRLAICRFAEPSRFAPGPVLSDKAARDLSD